MSDTDTYVRKYWEICDLFQSVECFETQKHILSFMHWMKKKVINLLFLQTVVQIANLLLRKWPLIIVNNFLISFD